MAPTPQDSSNHSLGSSGVSGRDTALLVNLVCRVVFAFIANFACWVPFRILWKNGEFAGSMFIATVIVLNFDCIVNALIWRDDNTDNWWPGYVLCDFHSYWYNAVVVLYATSNCAVMHNLSKQIGNLRASPLSAGEKRNRNIVQALIMFPIPILSIAFAYPIQSVRYVVATLVGCSFRGDPSWPILVFYILPYPLFALGSAYYAGESPGTIWVVNHSPLTANSAVTWFRFRQVRRTTAAALPSGSMSNTSAAARSHRAQRKLYFMTLVILIPYLTMQWAWLGLSLLNLFPLQHYDFNRIHHSNNPVSWDTITYVTSSDINELYMNANYVPIATAIPVFWVIGLTREGINIYRKYLVALGLGRLFSKLNE
jgi:pheromone a factor receptor